MRKILKTISTLTIFFITSSVFASQYMVTLSNTAQAMYLYPDYQHFVGDTLQYQSCPNMIDQSLEICNVPSSQATSFALYDTPMFCVSPSMPTTGQYSQSNDSPCEVSNACLVSIINGSISKSGDPTICSQVEIAGANDGTTNLVVKP
jgi:hypothetical protein